MRVDWCQTHDGLVKGTDRCAMAWPDDKCAVVPSVVIPLADVEDLLADLRRYEDGSPLAYPTWGGDRLVELIGGDDE